MNKNKQQETVAEIDLVEILKLRPDIEATVTAMIGELIRDENDCPVYSEDGLEAITATRYAFNEFDNVAIRDYTIGTVGDRELLERLMSRALTTMFRYAINFGNLKNKGQLELAGGQHEA